MYAPKTRCSHPNPTASQVKPIPAGDNTVFPMPSRTAAYYDNAVSPFTQLTDGSIVDNAAIIARGYKVAGGIDAFWISVGP